MAETVRDPGEAFRGRAGYDFARGRAIAKACDTALGGIARITAVVGEGSQTAGARTVDECEKLRSVIIGTNDLLDNTGVIRNPHSTNRELKIKGKFSVANRERACTRAKKDAVDLRLRIIGEGNACDIGEPEGRRIVQPVRHDCWRPIRGRVPVGAGRVNIPSGAAGEGCARR